MYVDPLVDVEFKFALRPAIPHTTYSCAAPAPPLRRPLLPVAAIMRAALLVTALLLAVAPVALGQVRACMALAGLGAVDRVAGRVWALCVLAAHAPLQTLVYSACKRVRAPSVSCVLFCRPFLAALAWTLHESVSRLSVRPPPRRRSAPVRLRPLTTLP